MSILSRNFNKNSGLILLSTAVLALSGMYGCDKPSSSQISCVKDTDCPGKSTCTLEGTCNACFKDIDCEGDQKCSEYHCESSTPILVNAGTPRELIDNLINDLASGDVNLVLNNNFLVALTDNTAGIDRYKGALLGYNLPELSSRLNSAKSSMKVNPNADSEIFVEYLFVTNCKNDPAKECEYALQMVRIKEIKTGKYVWKIQSL